MRMTGEMGLWVALFIANAWLAAQAGGPWLAIVTGIVLVVSCTLVNKVCNPFGLDRITIPGAWYLGYVLVNVLPGYLVYGSNPGPFRNRYLFGVLVVLLATPAGMVWTNFAMGGCKKESDVFFSQQIEPTDVGPNLSRAYAWLLGLVLFFTVLYVIEVPSIPLFHLLSSPDDYWELVLLREESFKLLQSHFSYIYYLLKALLYPFLVMLGLGGYLATRKRSWLLMFAAAVTAGLFYNSLTLAKAPIGFMVVSAAVFVYYYRGRLFRWRSVLTTAVLFLTFPMTIMMASGQVQASTALALLGARIFYLPAELLYYYFEVFPAQVGLLHGRTIEKIAWLFGMRFFDADNFVGLYAIPNAVDSVSAPAAFIGYLNADFGLVGVVIGAVFAGALMQALHIWYVRQRRNVITLAGYSFLVFAFVFLNFTSMMSVLAGNGVVFSVLLTLLLLRIAGSDTQGARRVVTGAVETD